MLKLFYVQVGSSVTLVHRRSITPSGQKTRRGELLLQGNFAELMRPDSFSGVAVLPDRSCNVSSPYPCLLARIYGFS